MAPSFCPNTWICRLRLSLHGLRRFVYCCFLCHAFAKSYTMLRSYHRLCKPRNEQRRKPICCVRKDSRFQLSLLLEHFWVYLTLLYCCTVITYCRKFKHFFSKLNLHELTARWLDIWSEYYLDVMYLHVYQNNSAAFLFTCYKSYPLRQQTPIYNM